MLGRRSMPSVRLFVSINESTNHQIPNIATDNTIEQDLVILDSNIFRIRFLEPSRILLSEDKRSEDDYRGL